MDNSSCKIKSALISVYYKDNLEPIVRELVNLGVNIYSTGGTKDFIEKLGVKVISVEDLTSYPSILGGRVKTLHPKIFGGILARRENQQDLAQLKEYQIPEIDLVIVDLYPFEETVAKETDEQKIIEKIDIGGISLIRAAAKNFNDTLIVSSRQDYVPLLNLLKEKKGFSDLGDRKLFAAKAFNISSHYDTAIFSYFKRPSLTLPEGERTPSPSGRDGVRQLRYGENPHQQANFYGKLEDMLEQLHGKELSYNNLVDIDAAVHLIAEFDKPTFAILKHTNSCGVASAKNLSDAWKLALAGDPVSAFGGVIICNEKIDETTAKEINQLFFEVIIAPAYEEKALEILKQKKNRMILIQKKNPGNRTQFKTILNGVLEQDADLKTENVVDLKVVTKKSPSEKETNDLIFANKIVKHLKSNAIALVKNEQLVGMGCGQTSRVDALKIAIEKAKNFKLDLKGSVLASDAFFPFSDCVEIAHQAGITTFIQPGGSVKDKDSIDYCNKNELAMVFTGIRHFKH